MENNTSPEVVVLNVECCFAYREYINVYMPNYQIRVVNNWCLCVCLVSRRMAECPRKRSSTGDAAESLSGRHSCASDAGAGVTLQKQIGLLSACGFIIGRSFHAVGETLELYL